MKEMIIYIQHIRKTQVWYPVCIGVSGYNKYIFIRISEHSHYSVSSRIIRLECLMPKVKTQRPAAGVRI